MKRPILSSIQDSPSEILLTRLAFLLVVGTAAWLALQWPAIPELIPSPFRKAGELTLGPVLASRNTLLAVPVLSGIQFLFLTWIRGLPHRHNYPVRITEENAPRQYALSRLATAQIRAFLSALLFWNSVQATRLALGLPRLIQSTDFEVVVALGTLAAILAFHFRRALREG